MYNQVEAILSQYEIELQDVTKGRGSFVCDTTKGKMLLVPFRGSKEKGLLLHCFLTGLEGNGFKAEQIFLTKKGEAVAEDEYTGERFLLKSHVEGTEISTSKLEEMKEAVHLLAIYHNIAETVARKMGMTQEPVGTIESWEKHYKELIKVRNYIRNRKKKSEFEQIYMKHFEHNRKAAEKSILMLEEVPDTMVRYVFCHGDFNQHNVLRSDAGCKMVHFENFVMHWGMLDLANFIRKMLEKNEWNEKIGRELIEEYNKYRCLQPMEYQLLYGLLMFPEKFWKVTNHYIASRKTWISGREIDKLKKVIEQEERRLKFLENVFAFLEE